MISMEQFNWNKEDILNSDLDPYTKDVLLGELASSPSLKDPHIEKTRILFQPKEKYEYQKHLRTLYQQMPEITPIIIKSYQKFPIFKVNYKPLPQIDIDPDNIIKSAKNFYEFIGSDELLNSYLSLINQKGKIRIQPYNPNNPLCNHINGRCLIDNSTQKGFISCYTKGTFEDYTTFIHETAHLIIETLLVNQMNPLIEKHFTEYAAYYLQLISYHFYGEYFKIPEIFSNIFHNHIVRIISNMWFLHFQALVMQKKFTIATPDYLRACLAKENLDCLFTQDDIVNLYINPIQTVETIAAFLMALDSFEQNTPTIKEGIIHLRNTLTSPEQSILDLLKNNNITFIEDDMHNFQTAYEKTLGLHLK